MYRRLLDVVAAEAARNERFLNDLKSVVNAPSRAWTLLMYFQLRTRLEAIMSRFDQDPRKHDAISTATRLKGLIDAIDSMVEPDNWKVMDPITKQQYFGLLLDLLRGVMDRDRARDSQGSRSPYVTESRRDVDLYQQLKDTQENKDGVIRGAALLQSMFNQLSPYGLDARQIEHIGSTLRTVENRYGLSGTGVVTTSPDPTRVLVAHLRQMQFGKQCRSIIGDYADLVVHSTHQANTCQLPRLTLIAILLRSDSILVCYNTIPLTDFSGFRCCAGRSTLNRLLLSRDTCFRICFTVYLDNR
jgi:hypothetical protein